MYNYNIVRIIDSYAESITSIKTSYIIGFKKRTEKNDGRPASHL